VKTNGDVKLTIAGLNTKIYQQKIKEVIKASEFPKVDFNRLYRPNTSILPEACRKLLKVRDNMGYDKNGDWRGCTLESVGFFSINLNSKFHINNTIQCAILQGLKPDYYLGSYNSTLYLTLKGFDFKERSGYKYEQFYALEENQTISGGRV